MAHETQNRRDALVELAENNSTRSYTAQIRDLYDVIEHALASGVSRTVIHQKLVDTGLAISLRHFDQALYRIRRGKKHSEPSRHVPDGKNQTAAISKQASTSAGKIKPQANFRQSLKQIREEVENTDWARVISKSSRSAQS